MRPPDALVGAADGGPMVDEQEDRERLLELEEVAVHEARLLAAAAGQVLDQGLGQLLAVLDLLGEDEARAREIGDLGGVALELRGHQQVADAPSCRSRRRRASRAFSTVDLPLAPLPYQIGRLSSRSAPTSARPRSRCTWRRMSGSRQTELPGDVPRPAVLAASAKRPAT